MQYHDPSTADSITGQPLEELQMPGTNPSQARELLILSKNGTRVELAQEVARYFEIISGPLIDSPIRVELTLEQYQELRKLAQPAAATSSQAKATIGASSIEHEAKFLINYIPELSTTKHAAIKQDYLAIAEDGAELRIRNKDGNLFQTIKRKAASTLSSDQLTGLGAESENLEVEIVLTAAQFELLSTVPAIGSVFKTRHELQFSELGLELDQYSGDHAGLWVVELEATPELIAWFRSNKPDWVGTEITSDKRYKNKNILEHGIPDDTTLFL